MKEYIVEYETEQIENSTFFYGGKIEHELIRCKDCKYWLPHEQRGRDADFDEYNNYCERHMPDDEWYAGVWNADDFCSRAEPKDKP